MKVVNRLDQSVHVRWDVIGNGQVVEGGFSAVPPKDFPVWRYHILAHDSNKIDMSSGGAHHYIPGITIRIAVITDENQLLLNDAFSTDDLDDIGWELRFGP